MIYYVYSHINAITKEVFYIGKGKDKRAYIKRGRSNYWKRIVNKYGYEIEIIHSNLSNEEACKLEKEYILKYGRRDIGTGILINFTDGGEGTLNRPMNDKTKKILKEINTGKPTSKLQKEIVGNRYRGKTGILHNRSKKIICIETQIKYGSMSEASRELKISVSSISYSVKNGRSVFGMHFQINS